MNRGVMAPRDFDMLPMERVPSVIQRQLDRGIYGRLV